ncbi:MAG: coproporphyrinogen III oxidase [Gemmataceae bacterium]
MPTSATTIGALSAIYNTDSPQASLLPPWEYPRAAYVHIPFCAHRCWYCDFAVVVARKDLVHAYLLALQKELARLGSQQPVRSVFIGGGTPTLLDPPDLERLLDLVRHWFPPDGDAEWSIEANPGDLTTEKICLLAEKGINRVSVGVQSFQPHLLRFLERDHDPALVMEGVYRLVRVIPNVSVDLIFGVPSQSLGQWEQDLHQACALGVQHVSTYGLTYEKGTRLWKSMRAGRVVPLDEGLERDMYALAMDLLQRYGFEQYEISNFARAGYRCRHNEVYWANDAYFGVGLGAARYVHGRRQVNTRSLHTYIERLEAGLDPTQTTEELTPIERARETAMLQLRRCQGILRADFRLRTGFDLDRLCRRAIVRMTTRGLVTDTGQAVALTREGRFIADYVCGVFWNSSALGDAPSSIADVVRTDP